MSVDTQLRASCHRVQSHHSLTSSDGAFFGASSSVELSEVDDEPLAILEKKLERTGVTGTLFVAEGFDGVFFDSALFDDSVLEGFGLEDASFSFSFSLSFDEELFEGFDFGDFGGSVFDRESFGGAGELSGNAPIGDLDDEVFAGVGFDAAGFDAATLGVGVGFAGATFGDGGLGWAAFDAALGIVTFEGATFGGGWLICAGGGCAVN
jgi:hypothetical protein